MEEMKEMGRKRWGGEGEMGRKEKDGFDGD